MDEYCEENAKRYAEENFSANLSEQYQRFLTLLKKGASIFDANCIDMIQSHRGFSSRKAA